MDPRLEQALSFDGVYKALKGTLDREISKNPRFEVDPQVDMLLSTVAEVMATNNQLLMSAFRVMLTHMRTARAVPTESEKAINEAVNRVPDLPPQA
jgi:hypothetical protein